MIKKTVYVNTFDEINEFNKLCNNCDFDTDLVQGRYTINAKSIMGICSLNLNGPIILVGYTDDESKIEIFEKFYKL